MNAATYVDFSTSYDINRHFNVYFEALNLTDQIYARMAASASRSWMWSTPGARSRWVFTPKL